MIKKELFRKLSGREKFFLIAGPCVIESRDELFRIAEFLVKETGKRDLLLIFKSSYEKANRTSVSSYRGPGLRKGLELLQEVKTHFGIPVLTDIHEQQEAEEASTVADIIQIPAFLSRQTLLLEAAGRTGRLINIKKGQFMAAEDMRPASEKILATGNENIILTERGTSFGYHDLVVDFRSFAVLAELGFPVVYDVTHSLQRPSVGKTSGGSPEYAQMMARAAIATGKVNGLFIETHPDPVRAQSDAASMLKMSELPRLLDVCLDRL